ncbi:hypothetical protein PAMP_011951 [Pampus punctatissimus]
MEKLLWQVTTKPDAVQKKMSQGRNKTLATIASEQGAVGEEGHYGQCLGGCSGGRALCPGPQGASSRMGLSIRWEDDPSYPCGVWLVQLYLIGQEQRAALHRGRNYEVLNGGQPDSLINAGKYSSAEVYRDEY